MKAATRGAKRRAAIGAAAAMAVLASGLWPTGPASALEKILSLPALCAEGDCPPTGIFVELAPSPGQPARGRLDYLLIDRSWSADIEVFCDLRGAAEIVYSIEPPVRRVDRVWVKSDGAEVLLGYSNARGRAEERPYGDAGTEAALRAAFDAPNRGRLPETARAEDLVWIARAIWARTCG